MRNRVVGKWKSPKQREAWNSRKSMEFSYSLSRVVSPSFKKSRIEKRLKYYLWN